MAGIFLLISVIFFVVAVSQGQKMEKRDFERTNQYGVREFKNWDDRQHHRLQQGTTNIFGGVSWIIACLCLFLSFMVWFVN